MNEMSKDGRDVDIATRAQRPGGRSETSPNESGGGSDGASREPDERGGQGNGNETRERRDRRAGPTLLAANQTSGAVARRGVADYFGKLLNWTLTVLLSALSLVKCLSMLSA